jgi:hypothetical protein
MRPALERLLAVTVAVLAATPLACSRRDGPRNSAVSHRRVGENPRHLTPVPAQPAVPQDAGRDSLLNRFRTESGAMGCDVGAVQPGFGLDSTWLVERTPWRPLARVPAAVEGDRRGNHVRGPRPRSRMTATRWTWMPTNDGRRHAEVGGEPDSQCTLIDHHSGLESVLGFSGAPGYHWGVWLTPGVFAVGSWRDADDSAIGSRRGSRSLDSRFDRERVPDPHRLRRHV